MYVFLVEFRTDNLTDARHLVAAEWYRKISRWLADGSFKPNRPKVLPGGLESVSNGLQLLETGNVHGEKLVYRITDTPGLKA